MNSYAPASACGRGCLPRAGAVPTAPGAVQVLRLVALGSALAVSIAVALAMPLVSRRLRARLLGGLAQLMLRAAGIRLVVRGEPLAGPALVAANHVSWLDIPAILAVQPIQVVAKTDVRRWPVIGLVARRCGTLFIDRGSLRHLPATVADIATSLRGGRSVLVFPEGSTWCGRTQGRFAPAAFQAAVDAGVPVRPVLLRYRLADGTATTAAAFVGSDTLVASVRRVVAVARLTVEVELAPPLPPVTDAAAPTANGAVGEAGPAPWGRSTARRRLASRTAAVTRPAAMAQAVVTASAHSATHRSFGVAGRPPSAPIVAPVPATMPMLSLDEHTDGVHHG